VARVSAGIQKEYLVFIKGAIRVERVAEVSHNDYSFKNGIDRSKLSDRQESEIYFSQHDEENESYQRITSNK
jgi:hypothetical protein